MLLNIIEIFLSKVDSDYKSVENGEIKFEYNGEELNEFNKALKDLKIVTDTDIIVKDFTIDNEGFKPMKFVNVFSLGNPKEKNFLNYDKGLNLFKKCKNQNCVYNKKDEFTGKEVITNYELKEKFIYVLKEEKCEKCGNDLELITCGFWKCEYQFIGKYKQNGIIHDYESKPKETEENDFDYFDPKESGNIIWTELKIYVLPIQEIKYNPDN